MAMDQKSKKHGWAQVFLYIFIALVLACTGYIMVRGLGLVDSLDFGAGAYYYADIPEFQRFVNADAYVSPVPMWAIILIFLAWGAAMYRFWIWADKKWR
ncbi:MAG: hypothetical protein Q4F81_10760 [Eubacteriales bacterium]|nr:hypothetical protein [Eubacteriales bacterium]